MNYFFYQIALQRYDFYGNIPNFLRIIYILGCIFVVKHDKMHTTDSKIQALSNKI